MALLLAVVAALVAYTNAGMMQMMQPNMQQQMYMQQQMQMQQMQQQHMVPAGHGCQQDAHGNMPQGCEIPMGTVDVEEYLEQQMKQQQYETQQMAEKIKAQFEGMVRDVTVKKHRYVMSLVTEFMSFCTCAGTSQAYYEQVFLNSARALNITDGVEIWDANRLPYQAQNQEEARGLIFGGLVRTMCEAAATFNTFADQVTQRVTAIRATQAAAGKK